jgi:hypothetical protein
MNKILRWFKDLSRKSRKPLIRFQEEDQTLWIEDGQQNSMVLVKIVLVINLVNTVLIGGRPLRSSDPYEEIETLIIWGLVGLASLGALLVMQFSKNSFQKKIPLDQIDSWAEWNVLGVKNRGLLLKNGKRRSLNPLLKKMSVSEIKSRFREFGIQGLDESWAGSQQTE